jgi:hypothetical protein
MALIPQLHRLVWCGADVGDHVPPERRTLLASTMVLVPCVGRYWDRQAGNSRQRCLFVERGLGGGCRSRVQTGGGYRCAGAQRATTAARRSAVTGLAM